MLGVLHVAGGVAVIEGVIEGVADTAGVDYRGIPVALSFVLAFMSLWLAAGPPGLLPLGIMYALLGQIKSNRIR